jgi:hypothetical protein
MKKIILSLGLLALTASATIAQDKKITPTDKKNSLETMPMKAETTAPATPQNPDAMKFKEEIHDFGTIPQNKPVTQEFNFKNTGKEPIVIQNVHASCGCTTPEWTKEPVLPGKTGTVKATYNAAAAAPFTKTITVTSNIGTKMLTIKGTVEKAPESSVPQNSSSVKTH